MEENGRYDLKHAFAPLAFEREEKLGKADKFREVVVRIVR